MAASELTAYWIRSPVDHAPLGFGVTAWTLSDALQIIQAVGYEQFLPDDLSDLSVDNDITVAMLDQPHVVANMGPINLRGMWYPFIAIGVPEWAQERIANRQVGRSEQT